MNGTGTNLRQDDGSVSIDATNEAVPGQGLRNAAPMTQSGPFSRTLFHQTGISFPDPALGIDFRHYDPDPGFSIHFNGPDPDPGGSIHFNGPDPDPDFSIDVESLWSDQASLGDLLRSGPNNDGFFSLDTDWRSSIRNPLSLGGLPDADQSVASLGEWLQEIETWASQVSPSEAARIQNFSREKGVSPDLTIHHDGLMQTAKNSSGRDWTRFTLDFPSTARWLAKPENFLQGWQEADRLADLERQIRSFGESLVLRYLQPFQLARNKGENQ